MTRSAIPNFSNIKLLLLAAVFLLAPIRLQAQTIVAINSGVVSIGTGADKAYKINVRSLNFQSTSRGSGKQVATPSLKPASTENIQYVSPNGSDRNDGLSPGSAKLTGYAACQALPGGSAGVCGRGTIMGSGQWRWGGPAPNQGMWIMGGGDPNFSHPPTGWLKGTGAITLDCLFKGDLNGAHGHSTACILVGGGNSDDVHPVMWISSFSQGVSINNTSLSPYRFTYVKFGIDSNNIRTGSGGSSGFSMTNVGWLHGSGALGCGPGLDVGDNSFWIWLKDMSVTGCPSGATFTITASTGANRSSNVVTIHTTAVNNVAVNDIVTIANVADDSFDGSFKVTSVPDKHHFTFNQYGPNARSGSGQVVTLGSQAINLGSGIAGGGGTGLVFIDDINLNSGGIRINPGLSGGSMYIRNISYESDNTHPDPPTVLVTSVVVPTLIHVENVEQSDQINPIPIVQVDNSSMRNLDSVIVSRSSGYVRGYMTVLGGALNDQTLVKSPIRSGMAGFFNGRFSGGVDAGRRLFSPTAAISANLATTNPSSWSYLVGAGTITAGVASPDGNSGAGRATSKSGQSQVQFFISNNASIALGDVYIYGVWVRSQTANGYTNNIPLTFGLNANGFGSGDGCTPGS